MMMMIMMMSLPTTHSTSTYRLRLSSRCKNAELHRRNYRL